MNSKITYSGILHASVLVADVSRSLAFYQDVLGLELSPNRPDLPFPGAWLQIGRQQIHLMQLPNTDPVNARPEYGGRDRHTAIGVDDLDAVITRLEQGGVEFSRSSTGRRIFCRDPDGNTLEIVGGE